MTILVVRHADAGDRAAWTGDDTRRPVSALGRRQSEALVEVHATQRLDRIVSSPARRCLDTVAPIANARGMAIESHHALAEGTPFEVIDALLRRCSTQDVLLCSHGDLIGMIVPELIGRGVVAGSATWSKASTWILDTWPDTTQAEYTAEPDVG